MRERSVDLRDEYPFGGSPFGSYNKSYVNHTPLSHARRGHGGVNLRSDLDEQAAVVARAPLLDAIHGPHIHALVKSVRGEDVVQLIVACRHWVPAGEVERHNVSGALRFVCRQRLRLSSVRRLWPHELHANGLHPLEHGPVECIPVGRSAAISVAMQDVEVASGQDAMCLRVLVADERREVRDDAVDGGVGVAEVPGGLDARMRPDVNDGLEVSHL